MRNNRILYCGIYQKNPLFCLKYTYGVFSSSLTRPLVIPSQNQANTKKKKYAQLDHRLYILYIIHTLRGHNIKEEFCAVQKGGVDSIAIPADDGGELHRILKKRERTTTNTLNSNDLLEQVENIFSVQLFSIGMNVFNL